MLSITPRLIRNVQRQTAAAGEFLSGTDGSLRRRATPASAEPAPEAEAGAVASPAVAPAGAASAPLAAPLAKPAQ